MKQVVYCAQYIIKLNYKITRKTLYKKSKVLHKKDTKLKL